MVRVVLNNDSSGGVVLASEDGKIVLENTLDARLELAFKQKLPEVYIPPSVNLIVLNQRYICMYINWIFSLMYPCRSEGDWWDNWVHDPFSIKKKKIKLSGKKLPFNFCLYGINI